MHARTPWQLATATSAVASVLLLAGCGGDSAGDAAIGGGAAQVDVAAAQATIDPLTKPATEFPITEPLAKRPAPGTKVAFLDNGTPVAGRTYEDMSKAAEVLGIELGRVQTGQSPQEINAAMNSVVESKPAAVIDVAIDPALFAPQVKELQDQGIPFIAQSIVNAEDFGLDDADGETVRGGPGFLAEFDPNEARTVRATEDARILLVLSPWPGRGHPSSDQQD